MSVAQAILRDLDARGVRVRLNGCGFIVNPRSEVPSDLVAQLREHKAEILAELEERVRWWSCGVQSCDGATFIYITGEDGEVESRCESHSAKGASA